MNSNDKQLLQEGWMTGIGNWSKTLLKLLYGDIPMVGTLDASVLSNLMKEDEDGEGGRKFVIRGKHRDVKAYAAALVNEKNYLDAYVEYGEDHPATVKARTRLDISVKEFESATGLLWPFKDEV
jgi:hypothetical protein